MPGVVMLYSFMPLLSADRLQESRQFARSSFALQLNVFIIRYAYSVVVGFCQGRLCLTD